MIKKILIALGCLLLVTFTACTNTETDELETEETSYENYVYPFSEDSEFLLEKDPIELIKNDPEKFKENFGDFISDKEIEEILNLMNIFSLNKDSTKRYKMQTQGTHGYGAIIFLLQNLKTIEDKEFEPADENTPLFTYDEEWEGEGYTKYESNSLIMVKNEQDEIKYIITDIFYEDSGPGGVFSYNADVIMAYDENDTVSKLLILPHKNIELRDTPLFSYAEFDMEKGQEKTWNCMLETNQLATPRIFYHYYKTP